MQVNNRKNKYKNIKNLEIEMKLINQPKSNIQIESCASYLKFKI